MLFQGPDEGPRGLRWPIHGPLPEVRWVEKMIHLANLRENHWSLPSQKAAKENRLFLGVNSFCLGPLMGVPGIPAS